MRSFLCVCMMLFLSVAVHAAFLADTDIPLMDGLVVDEGESFSFDTPAGQILTFTAKTLKSVNEVRYFYQTALKELGWKAKSSTKYEREQDELELQISASKGQTLVKIQLTFVNK